jgi:phospholipid/cholesterol/gamma-HCH transport system permease protein
MFIFLENCLLAIKEFIINTIASIGRYITFLYYTITSFNKFHRRIPNLFEQMRKIGVGSLPLVAITSAFTGMVTAVQASYQTGGFLPYKYIGSLIAKSTMIELAPVLTGLVMAGKIGATLAAEIGAMRVSDQIDALEISAVNPFDYLILPRIIAGVVMLPVLTIFSNLFGILSGYIVSLSVYHVSGAVFLNGIRTFFRPMDLWSGLIKSVAFGIIITSVGCYQGFYAKGGAEGVGKVTTRAVVVASIMILVMDYLVAALLFK